MFSSKSIQRGKKTCQNQIKNKILHVPKNKFKKFCPFPKENKIKLSLSTNENVNWKKPH